MSGLRPEFLKVLPADIARVGALGATILALVRYATSLPGEANGRMVIDGATWWRGSYPEIGVALGGVPRENVRRAIGKLELADELQSVPAGDRAFAYRTPTRQNPFPSHGPDQPSPGNGSPLTSHHPETGDPSPGNGSPHHPETGDAPISLELKEKRENASGVRPQSSPPITGPFGPRCRRHIAVQDPGPCGGCGEAGRAHQKALAAYKAEQNAARAAIRATIDECEDCDDFGRLDDLTDCPKHVNYRQGGISA